MAAGCLQVFSLIMLFSINTFNHRFLSLRTKAIVFVVLFSMATVFLPFIAFVWAITDNNESVVF